MKKKNINKQDKNIRVVTKSSKGNEKYKQEINKNNTWNKTWTLQREKVRKWSWSENQDA
jgi:hypothetical protein